MKVKKQGKAGMTLEKLSRMVADGFHDMGVQFKDVRSDISAMKDDIHALKDGQRRLEIKVDRALYHEYVSLESRVTRLEGKVGIGK